MNASLQSEKDRMSKLRADFTTGRLGMKSNVEIMKDFEFLFSILDRAKARINTLQEEVGRHRNKGKNYAANCALMLGDNAFCQWIAARERINFDPANLLSKASVEAALKGRLQIISKKELNTDETAAQRWLDLLREYNRGNRS